MARLTKLKGNPTNTMYAKTYSKFLGVDFSKDASMVDETRSPDAENIISDIDGFPEKRVGWREITKLQGRINGIFTFGDREERVTVVHAGEKIYKLSDGEAEVIFEGAADSRSQGKYFRGYLCILTGREFLVFDGEKCTAVSEVKDMYAPITHIGRLAGSVDHYNLKYATEFMSWWKTGKLPFDAQAGVIYENAELNLASGWRKNCFEVVGSGNSANLFILDATIDLGSRIVIRHIPTGEVLADISFSKEERYEDDYYVIIDSNQSEEIEGINKEFVNSVGATELSVNYLMWLGNSKKNGCGFVAISPKLTELGEVGHTPGIDNFSVEFSHVIEGYAERIGKCRFMDVFENRVFFSGNPDYPNTDWYSAVNDPLFIPDINYTEIGLSSSKIMGYLRSGDSQAIIKSDGDGASSYLRSYQTLSDGSVIFPVKQGLSGLGAVSENAITLFLDDPVFLTRNGVYAIARQDISSERALALRSTRINARLLLEENLSDAQMCEWNGYLLLAINGKCFVADAAQKSYSGNFTGEFEYEWYYWTNIPARCLASIGDTLYFGTEDGRVCRFNNDMKNERGELECAAYSDNGEAIRARWSTPLSDDGDFMRIKTMPKTGSGVFLKSYDRSGVEVLVRTDSGKTETLVKRSAGIFSFSDIDFSDFTFNTSPYTVVPFNSRVKKYKAIQIICKNEKPNQPFGIGGIIRKYFYGKTNK